MDNVESNASNSSGKSNFQIDEHPTPFDATSTSAQTSIWDIHLPPLQTEGQTSKGEILECLDTLASVLQALEIPDASFPSYSEAINRLSHEKFTLSRSLNRHKCLEDELIAHLNDLKVELERIKHWNETLVPGTPSSPYPETTATLERRREALVKKAKEQQRELESLIAKEPLEISVSVGQLVAQKERNQALEREIKEKRTKLKTFQGLPPNFELARHELRMARQRQIELMNLREKLLGEMADGVS